VNHQNDFIQFNTDHPDVYEELVTLARNVKNRGYTNYGIASLFEVMRYHRATSGRDRLGFKMNNNYRSHYARLIMEQEDDLEGFFRTRKLATA
jgi:hypothetical protein